ncbi:class A beta-lactamase [Tsuneonella flava]|uniref:beta-lactamase n=1 Tax=Tsuneonella flava TaxID=2055955 RepID=A0ABX7K978_9SPHN|nr:class A beta-lactamase [Tsuneonella flava]QSB44388.1 class A beta-lactamase [Tsuneonella flava]
MKFNRRTTLAGAGALIAGACVPLQQDTSGRLTAKLRLIEVGSGGTLGVMLLNTADGQAIGHNSGERFAMCSTFKASLAALALDRAAKGALDLDKVLHWRESDLQSYAPFAKERLATGATIRELARAAQVLSDNTAANLVLDAVGGPSALTQFWRSLGDDVSRLDNIEPLLNVVLPGRLENTTTPDAMARTLAKILFGGGVVPQAAQTLQQWMRETQTGTKKVRAGLPAEWAAGDKTGFSGSPPGMQGVSADIGFAIPSDGAPIVFATYHRATTVGPPSPMADAAMAQVGGVIRQFAGD